MSRAITAVAVLSFVALAPVAAQSTYAPPGGDTLRYRETQKTSVVITTPQGEIQVSADQDATLGIKRFAGDSAHAWFEALSLVAQSPQGEQKPATDAILRKPFRLTFDSRGRVKLVEAPAFPQELAAFGDMANEFTDLFFRLPTQPLRVGLAWTDTLTRRDSTAERQFNAVSVTNYTVDKDTVVNGTPAVKVRMTQHTKVHAEGPVPQQPGARTDVTMEGDDTGFYVFAPKPGRMLARRRTGKLAGDVAIPAAGMTMKQAIDYTNTVDAVK
jgi:hypothetical protein